VRHQSRTSCSDVRHDGEERLAQANEYDDWQEMLQKEDLEAVHIATPLWMHSSIAVGALNAGKHVLCEKMMAKSPLECQQMIDAAKKNNRVLEIGYQRFYNPIYQAAYANIIKQGLLGDVYYARLAWHRNSTGAAMKQRLPQTSTRAVSVIQIGNIC
jgi:predicted dehydrogenase